MIREAAARYAHLAMGGGRFAALVRRRQELDRRPRQQLDLQRREHLRSGRQAHVGQSGPPRRPGQVACRPALPTAMPRCPSRRHMLLRFASCHPFTETRSIVCGWRKPSWRRQPWSPPTPRSHAMPTPRSHATPTPRSHATRRQSRGNRWSLCPACRRRRGLVQHVLHQRGDAGAPHDRWQLPRRTPDVAEPIQFFSRRQAAGGV